MNRLKVRLKVDRLENADCSAISVMDRSGFSSRFDAAVTKVIK